MISTITDFKERILGGDQFIKEPYTVQKEVQYQLKITLLRMFEKSLAYYVFVLNVF